MAPVVGFIGVGNQGGPIARRIIDAGYQVHLWARRPESLEPYTDTDAVASPTKRELGAACDVVGVCVVADADVLGVIDGDDGLFAGMRPGSILLIHSTVSPELCQELAARGAAHGITVLDAPVSGGHERAKIGDLSVMVGGDKTTFERVLPILLTFGKVVERVGPVGAGQLAKLINNVVFTVNLGVALRALETGVDLGLDADALRTVVMAGSGQSFALQMAPHTRLDTSGRAESLLSKDVGLFRDVLAARSLTSSLIDGAADGSLRAIGGRPESS